MPFSDMVYAGIATSRVIRLVPQMLLASKSKVISSLSNFIDFWAWYNIAPLAFMKKDYKAYKGLL